MHGPGKSKRVLAWLITRVREENESLPIELKLCYYFVWYGVYVTHTANIPYTRTRLRCAMLSVTCCWSAVGAPRVRTASGQTSLRGLALVRPAAGTALRLPSTNLLPSSACSRSARRSSRLRKKSATLCIAADAGVQPAAGPPPVRSRALLVLAASIFLTVLFLAYLVVAGLAAQAAVAAFVRSELFVAAVLAAFVAGFVPCVVWVTEKSAAETAQRAADVAAQVQRDAAQTAQRAADVAAQVQRDAALQKALTQLAASTDVSTRRLSSTLTGLESVRNLAAPSAPASLCSWSAARLGKWFADSEQWKQYGPVFARHDGWAASALTQELQLIELGVLEEHAGALLVDLRSIR